VPPPWDARCISSKHLCASGVSEITCCSCHCQAAQSHANADRQACMPLVIHTLSVWFRPAEPTLPHTTCTVYQHPQQTNVYVLGLRGYAPVRCKPHPTQLHWRQQHILEQEQAARARATTASETTTQASRDPPRRPALRAPRCTQWGRSRSRLQSQPQDRVALPWAGGQPRCSRVSESLRDAKVLWPGKTHQAKSPKASLARTSPSTPANPPTQPAQDVRESPSRHSER
jgi:hypothetical protein